MPKYSIIVPVYNSANYLQKCINSIVQQTCGEWELILVDDGSTDGSGRICAEYEQKDSRIRLIKQNNSGVSVARKNGTENANGSYILFLDSDDWLDKDCLKSVDNTIEKKSPDVVVFGFYSQLQNGGFVAEKLNNIGLFDLKMLQKEVYPSLIRDKTGSHFRGSLCGCVFQKNKIFPFLLSNSEAKIAEDSACVIPAIANSNSVFFMEECLYYYRYNSASATKKKGNVLSWNLASIIAEHIMTFVDIEKYDFKQQLYRKTTQELFLITISQFYTGKRYKEVKRDISQHLNEDFYQEAIQNAEFSGSVKHKLALYALKYRLYPLMYLYSKLK